MLQIIYTYVSVKAKQCECFRKKNLFTDNPKGDHSDSKWRKIIEGNGNHNWLKKDTDWRVTENRQVGNAVYVWKRRWRWMDMILICRNNKDNDMY